VWEYWNGISRTWRRLSVLDNSNGMSNAKIPLRNDNEYLEWTIAKIEFICPYEISKVKVNAEEKFWIRARILYGDFGNEIEIVESTIYYNDKGEMVNDISLAKNIVSSQRLKNVEIHYPIINNIKLSYQTAHENPDQCFSYNNADFQDVSIYNNFKNKPFQPFILLPERKNTIFFGFDRKLTGSPLRMLFSVKKEIWEDKSVIGSWSYWNGLRWEELKVTDNTNCFRKIGSIEFSGKNDFTELELFDRKRYWLRVEQPMEGFSQEMIFNGIYLNAVDALQSSFVKDEQIGASIGAANQSFKTLHAPLICLEVWVREPNLPGKKELLLIEQREGNDAVKVISEGDAFAGEVWIRWHAVENFDLSCRDDRHYIVDKRTGVISFGNGESGMIPPKAPANLSVTYRYGGGAAGNVSQGAISIVKTSIPFISSVVNPYSAAGGAEGETLEECIQNGSTAIAHRNRAVTRQDFEWIASAISRSVVRSKCIPHLNPDGYEDIGWITVIIVPDTNERPPTPKQELITIVKHGLENACMGTLSASKRIYVRGANYVTVKVNAVIQPIDPNRAAETEKMILESIRNYLDPIKGGKLNVGWEFGGPLSMSMIIALLENTDNVDSVINCQIYANDTLIQKELIIPTDTLLISGEHELELLVGDKSAIRAEFNLSECELVQN